MATSYVRPVLTPAAERTRSSDGGPDRPLVSLTTDFGERDPSAAICRGVILSIAPEVRLLDVSHEVAKYSILDGALLLWSALPYLPVGIHAAVVDPGVGTGRLPIGVRVARGDVLVGPDNGLLVPAAERLGGIRAVHALESAEYRLPVVSASFHGRDIFAPAAAHLALGVPLAAFGRALDPDRLVRLDLPQPEIQRGALATAVLYVDTFGNVKLAGERPDLEAALGELAEGDALLVDVGAGSGSRHTLQLGWQTTFGAVPAGQPLLYEDSYGRLCVAINQGNAGERFGLHAGDRVAIRHAIADRA
ncbi:MAG: SAM hydrolase/SAM-dependent halogenase family protein [Candidatus Limnocylindrales bacterium]